MNKPFWKKRAWWGFVFATVTSAGLAYTTDPNQVSGALKAIAIIGAALGGYSIQESVRAIAAKK